MFIFVIRWRQRQNPIYVTSLSSVKFLLYFKRCISYSFLCKWVLYVFEAKMFFSTTKRNKHVCFCCGVCPLILGRVTSRLSSNASRGSQTQSTTGTDPYFLSFYVKAKKNRFDGCAFKTNKKNPKTYFNKNRITRTHESN